MRNYAYVIIIGFLLLALGIVTMTGWILRIPQLVQLFPGLGMTFNTATCFALTGFGFLVTTYRHISLRNIAQISIGSILIILPGLILSQTLFSVNLHLDQLFVEAWLHDFNPYPGRMPSNACLAFMLVGYSFILLPFSYKKTSTIILQLNALLILVLGIIAATSYALKLELLYEDLRFIRMSFQASLGLIITSLGFWVLFWKNSWFQEFYLNREDKKITVLSGLILMCVSFTAGLAGYMLLAHESEKNIRNLFYYALNEDVSAFNNEIDKSVVESNNVYRLIFPQNAQQRVLTRDDVIRNLQLFQTKTPVKLTYLDNNQHVLYVNQGSFTTEEMKIKLNNPADTYMLWSNGFTLQTHIPLSNNLGHIIIDYPLVKMTKIVKTDDRMGKSSELQICAKFENQAKCFPTRLNENPYTINFEDQNFLTPMYYALSGQSGVKMLQDYRDNQVLAAFSPIGDTGLGVVLKANTVELFAPIKDNLNVVFPLIFIIIIFGSLLLYYQVQPLMSRTIKSEKHLRESEARLNLAVGSTSDGLWDWDCISNVVYYSPRFKEILGYEKDEITSSFEEFRSRLHPQDSQKTFAALEAHLQNKVPYNVEYRLQKKNGDYAWINARGHATWDENGRPIRMSGFITDITQRKEVERLKNEFVSTVSHELRTPLTSIRGSLDLISTGVAGKLPEKAEGLIKIAQKNCERLILLINDILDIQKIESGQMRFDVNWFSLKEIILQAIELNKGYAEKFKVKLLAKLPIIESQVYVDRDRLMQVLANLISNAVKFSPPNGNVEISTTDRGNEVRVAITDYGPGIPQEFYSKIFHRFEQVDGSTVKQVSGTGLGLNISKTIIERFGGKINFISQVNKGTTFYFDLPKPAQAVVEEVNDQIIFKRKILICEDDKDIAFLIKKMLYSEGIMADLAFTGQQAKTLLQKNDYLAITLDLILPDSDGLKLIREIRSEPKTKTIPIIVISIKAEEEKHKFKGHALDIIDWLPKPIDQSRLKEAIHKVNFASCNSILFYSEQDRKVFDALMSDLKKEYNILYANDIETAKLYMCQNVCLILWHISDTNKSEFKLLDIVDRVPVIILSETEISRDISVQVASAMIRSQSTDADVLSQIKTVITENLQMESRYEQ